MVWVETNGPCTVEVLGCPARTFAVEGHHYALVHCAGLEPGSITPYEVALAGTRVWPPADFPFPPSVVRTHDPASPTSIVFGSCRVCVPHEPPYSLRKDQHPRGREVDALKALVQRMVGRPPEEGPEAMVLLGDQVYADEVSPDVLEFIRSRRDPEVRPTGSISTSATSRRGSWPPTSSTSGCGRAARRARRCASSPSSRTARSRASAGASAATSARRDW